MPTFRPDTQSETDVIEEVARHHGYGAIPRTVPSINRAGALSPRQAERRLIRQVLTGLGVDEALPMPFLEPGEIEMADGGVPPVIITNPLAAEESALRTSLRPGLLKAVAYNASHRNLGVRLFEIGSVFRPSSDQVLPHEPEYLGVALAGADPRLAVSMVHVLADALALPSPRLDQVPVPGLHPSRSATIDVGGVHVGCVGEIDPARSGALGIVERVAWLELDLDRLLSVPHGDRTYRPVSRYPSSDLDLAFEVPDTVPAADVATLIAESAGPLLVSLDLFDVFRGAPLPDGSRSLAFRLRLQAGDHTLTDDEATDVRERVIAAVEAASPARLRA